MQDATGGSGGGAAKSDGARVALARAVDPRLGPTGGRSCGCRCRCRSGPGGAGRGRVSLRAIRRYGRDAGAGPGARSGGSCRRQCEPGVMLTPFRVGPSGNGCSARDLMPLGGDLGATLQHFAWSETLQSFPLCTSVDDTKVTIYHFISQAGWNRCHLFIYLSIYLQCREHCMIAILGPTRCNYRYLCLGVDWKV